MDRKNQNIKVFQDTYDRTQSMERTSELYSGLLIDYRPSHDFKNKSTITVKNVDCITECLLLSSVNEPFNNKNVKIGLLNFASDKKAGGGCQTGAKAQEEDICRCSSLYHSLIRHKYPLGPCDLIYSPNVYIVKDATYTPLDNNNVKISVLSMAAIRNPPITKNATTSFYEYAQKEVKDLMKYKIRMILQTANYHNLTHLVLGAFGCGVFANPANEVAHIFKELLDTEFKDSFAHITFALLEDPNDLKLNRVFKKILLTN